MNKKYNFLMMIIFLSPQLNFAAENIDNRGSKTSDRFTPTLLRLVGTGFGLISALALGTSIYGAIGSYALLNQPENRQVGQFLGYSAAGPGLNYPEYLKYMYGIDKVSSAKSYYTQNIFLKTLSESQGATIVAGLAAPPLVGASLISAIIARYLFNKAASYNNEEGR